MYISQFYGMFNGVFIIYLNFMAFLTCLCISQFYGFLTACLLYISILWHFNMFMHISVLWHVYDLSQFHGMFMIHLNFMAF